MHRLALRRAEAVDRGETVHLHAYGINDQRVAFPMTDGIAHRRRLEIRGMHAVHANVADIGVLIVNDGDIAVLHREHLQGEPHRQGERRRDRPALILRIGKALARNGELALLLHDGRGFGRENRILIVAHQLAGIGGAVRTAAQIPQRLRTRRHPFEIERVLAPAKLHHPRRGGRAGRGGRTGRGERGQSKHRRPEDAEEQSLAFHLMSPFFALSQKSGLSAVGR